MIYRTYLKVSDVYFKTSGLHKNKSTKSELLELHNLNMFIFPIFICLGTFDGPNNVDLTAWYSFTGSEITSVPLIP